MFKKIIFIFLLTLIPLKAFSYEFIAGLGYVQSNYKGKKAGGVVVSVDAYVPLLFDGLQVGIGTSYLGANLGSSKDLAKNFSVYSDIEEKNVTMNLLPVYLNAKYEYSFNKNFSAFISGKYGLSIANKQYYTGQKTIKDENGKDIQTKDKLEAWGNTLYGASIGISFFNNYMISLNYENLAIKNIYHVTVIPVDNQNEKTYIESVSIKLSYAIR